MRARMQAILDERLSAKRHDHGSAEAEAMDGHWGRAAASDRHGHVADDIDQRSGLARVDRVEREKHCPCRSLTVALHLAESALPAVGVLISTTALQKDGRRVGSGGFHSAHGVAHPFRGELQVFTAQSSTVYRDAEEGHIALALTGEPPHGGLAERRALRIHSEDDLAAGRALPSVAADICRRPRGAQCCRRQILQRANAGLDGAAQNPLEGGFVVVIAGDTPNEGTGMSM